MNLGVLSVFLSCAVASSLAATAAEYCHGLECPQWTVLNTTAHWELRRLEASKWVATNTTGFSEEATSTSMFYKLFAYISGSNSQGVKIDMTAPVITKITHGATLNDKSTFIEHFFLSKSQWANPIMPTDPHVFITDIPQIDIFVSTFGGYPVEKDFADHAKALARDVKAAGYSVDESYFYEAGYDNPYQFQNRHNEVWIVRK